MQKMWLSSNSVCLAMGDAVALNLMFETKQDHELFFELWKKYLGNMAVLINYHLTPTGWILLFKTKSSSDIERAYHDLRSQSKKAKANHTLDDVSRMLSEHFRIFLSQFVRRSNIKQKRRGTKVLQRFHRYVIEETTDFEYFFDLITSRFRKPSQKQKKYQADENGYDVKKEMKEESVWRVGTRMYMGFEKEFREKYGVMLLTPKSSVLRKLLDSSRIENFKLPFS